MPKAIVSVINDLSTDQRVHRTCLALQKAGFEVTLVGRKLAQSLPINKNYLTVRMNLLFHKGPFFYLEYTIRLFLFLFARKADLYYANDLDTLLPNYSLSKWRNKQLIYDTHEIFTEVPELANSNFKRNIWLNIEGRIFPKLKRVITVNESISNYFEKLYSIKPIIVRNIPHSDFFKRPMFKSRKDLGMPHDKRVVILQGAGINVHRGSEELVEAFKYINNAVLYIVGSGDVINDLMKRVFELNLINVFFIPKLPFADMIEYTRNADLAVTFDKPNNLNYEYSLPNKLFDYIHCGVPVLASNLVEVSKIINQYKIGDFIENHTPEHIVEKINAIFKNEAELAFWKNNLERAASELKWEIEEEMLLKCINGS